MSIDRRFIADRSLKAIIIAGTRLRGSIVIKTLACVEARISAKARLNCLRVTAIELARRCLSYTRRARYSIQFNLISADQIAL